MEGARSRASYSARARRKNREFVVSHKLEPTYQAKLSQPLKDVAILILETGLREVKQSDWIGQMCLSFPPSTQSLGASESGMAVPR